MIGFAAGDIPRIPLNLALLKSCDYAFCGNVANQRVLREWASTKATDG